MRSRAMIRAAAVVIALDAPARAQVAPAPEPTPVTGKWSPRLYGFAQLDAILDTTQSFTEMAGNAAIARPDTYAREHGRVQLSARHSRLGFKLSSPDDSG